MAGIRYKGQVFSGTASISDAGRVVYDNTRSGLTATDVQGAVDELKSNINTKMVIEKVTSDTKTIANNDRGVFYFSVAKTGYVPVGIVGIELSNNWMFLGAFTIEGGDSAQVIIHNRSGSSNSQTLKAYILYQSST